MCLNYLKNIKKIGYFTVKIDDIEQKCIKLFINENDSIQEKDFAIINIKNSILKVNKKLEDIERNIELSIIAAKENMKKNNRSVKYN